MAFSFLPTKADIEKITEKNNLGKLIKSKRLKGGFTSPVIMLNQKFVIKLNKGTKEKHLERITREAYLYGQLTKSGVPVPKLIVTDVTKKIVPYLYIVISLIKGGNLLKVHKQLDLKQQNSIAFEFGRILKKIHSIPITDFYQYKNLFDRRTVWKSDCVESFVSVFVEFRKFSLYKSISQIYEIDRIFKKFLDEVKFENENVFVLIHHDLNAKHLIINEGKIEGLIDFEFACFGDYIWDFQKLLSGFSVGNAFKKNLFLQGYGINKFDYNELIRLKFYTLIQGLHQVVATYQGVHGYPKSTMLEGYQLINKALNINL